MSSEKIYNNKGDLIWEILYPDEEKPRLVSEVVSSKDGSELPYTKLECGQWIIDSYARKYLRQKYRDFKADQDRRARWRR